MKTIEIIVSPDGQVKLQTKGFAGPSCQEASHFLEQALGTKTGDQPTSEFHVNVENVQQNRQRRLS